MAGAKDSKVDSDADEFEELDLAQPLLSSTQKTAALPASQSVESSVILPDPLPVLRLSPNEMFDHAFYFIYRAMEKAIIEWREDGEMAVNKQVSVIPVFDEDYNKVKHGVYGADFAAAGLHAVLLNPAVDDTVVRAGVSAGTIPLANSLLRIQEYHAAQAAGYKKDLAEDEKAQEPVQPIFMIPLAQVHRGRRHWTFLVVKGQDAYFYDPKSFVGSSYYSLSPTRDILSQHGFQLRTSAVSYAGFQDITNDTECGYLSSWMLGRVADQLLKRKEATNAELLTDANLWEEQVPVNNQLVHKINYGTLKNSTKINQVLMSILPQVSPDDFFQAKVEESEARGGMGNSTLAIDQPNIEKFRNYQPPTFWQRNQTRILGGIVFAAAIAVSAVFFFPALFILIPAALIWVAKTGDESTVTMKPFTVISKPVASAETNKLVNIGGSTKTMQKVVAPKSTLRITLEDSQGGSQAFNPEKIHTALQADNVVRYNLRNEKMEVEVKAAPPVSAANNEFAYRFIPPSVHTKQSADPAPASVDEQVKSEEIKADVKRGP